MIPWFDMIRGLGPLTIPYQLAEFCRVGSVWQRFPAESPVSLEIASPSPPAVSQASPPFATQRSESQSGDNYTEDVPRPAMVV